MLSHPCPPKTALDLEWPRLLEALASRCEGEPGRRLARALPFLETRAEIVQAMGEIEEAVRFDEEGDPLPLAALGDVEASLPRARVGSTLANEELREVRDLLAAARRLRRFLQSRRDRAPLLFEAYSTDPTLDSLEQVLTDAFDEDGTLSDRASARLGELRSERRATRERLVRRLDELIRQHGGVLQDAFWTERDGRYVLPVRADAHERFAGIVHATSGSGATIFIEPRVIVPMGNRQKMLDADVHREEEAVYAALSAQVAEHIDGISAAFTAMTEADLRAASCKLAKELKLSFPEVRDADTVGAGETAIELPGARHPLLMLDGVSVVPSDLSLGFRRAMVISGPNAGGKTVALKTLGLAALMVRAGLPVAAKRGAKVAIFDLVLTDVGDDQSIAKNLSTFSAHIRNIAQILDKTGPGVLVLLDELAGGTDPREGEALAAAVLDSLCARGGAVACTTHYEGLKALALGDERFDNASVGFDVATMTPTFHLAVGIPGASSALAVARRFGIPGLVIDRAQRFMSVEAISFEATVEKLAAERRALELARQATEQEAAALQAERRAVQAELERLQNKERAHITREGEALMQSIRRAREDLRSAQARLRGNRGDAAELRQAERAIDAVAKKVAVGGELEPNARDDASSMRPLAAEQARVGARIYVPRLRSEASVVETLAGGRVRVAVGPLKLIARIDELRSPEAPAKAPERNAGPRSRRTEAHLLEADAEAATPLSTPDNTVDLRGLRADDAVSLAEQFLDRSLGAGRSVAFFLHGHGTGAVRAAVRAMLANSAYVTKSRPGDSSEGGDAMTVAWMR